MKVESLHIDDRPNWLNPERRARTILIDGIATRGRRIPAVPSAAEVVR